MPRPTSWRRSSSFLPLRSGSSSSSGRAAGIRPRLQPSSSRRSSVARWSVSQPVSHAARTGQGRVASTLRRGRARFDSGPRGRGERLHAWTDGTEATVIAAGAMAVAVAVNSVGRLLVMAERRRTPLRQLWLRGVVVDGLEAVLMVPLIGALLITSQTSSVLVVTTMGAMLAALTIAQHTRRTTAAALVTEQENARRDQLTGAPNRRAFEEAMVTEHARIVRGGVPAALYVVDIDRFKSINDRHGHRVGDEVLIEVVRRLTDGSRPSDTVARWGGEEITVLAPGVRGRRQIEQVGERIRTLVGDLPVTTATETPQSRSRSGARCSTDRSPRVRRSTAPTRRSTRRSGRGTAPPSRSRPRSRSGWMLPHSASAESTSRGSGTRKHPSRRPQPRRWPRFSRCRSRQDRCDPVSAVTSPSPTKTLPDTYLCPNAQRRLRRSVSRRSRGKRPDRVCDETERHEGEAERQDLQPSPTL